MVYLFWDVMKMNSFEVGDIIKGQVTGIENYGIFININAEFNGLIHISEISEDFVKDINDFVKIGETIYCRVLGVDEENCNLKLSIKNINYKARKGKGKFNETVRGFSPLKDNLDNWINEKLEEIKNTSEI